MAKVVPSTIAGAYASTSELNANFAALALEFENCLSLDGASPSAMTADLDMNNQDILNVNNLFTTTITYQGQSFLAEDITVADAAALFTAVDVEAALAETAVALNVVEADIAALPAWTDYMAGHLVSGVLDVYASDLDSLVVSGRFSFIASGVTNEPSAMISTEYGIVETLARDADDSIQKVYGQTDTAKGKVWGRENISGSWTAWKLQVDPAGASSHPANSFFLMGA